MTAYFVTRHRGAIEWAQKNGIDAKQVSHLDPDLIQPGDQVLGTLPVHLAAEVCERGGLYFHLILDIPVELRGRDLDATTMAENGACLQEFVVSRKA